MASISMMFTDNTNGLSTHSYTFTEDEMNRIYKAIHSTYEEQLGKDAPLNAVLGYLTQNLVQHLLNTTIEEENKLKIKEFRKATPEIELKGT